LEEAKQNARIIADSDLGKKWDVIIKEVGGNFGDEDFTKASYVVMTSPLFPKEMLREMQGTLKYAKGGETPFEKLSDKVAKNYEGNKVPKKYQSLYGKTYDKSEAKEVGDKVAAKVYRLQLKNKKMKSGGEILYTEKHRKD
jgi:hypothetical protein